MRVGERERERELKSPLASLCKHGWLRILLCRSVIVVTYNTREDIVWEEGESIINFGKRAFSADRIHGSSTPFDLVGTHVADVCISTVGNRFNQRVPIVSLLELSDSSICTSRCSIHSIHFVSKGVKLCRFHHQLLAHGTLIHHHKTRGNATTVPGNVYSSVTLANFSLISDRIFSYYCQTLAHKWKV